MCPADEFINAFGGKKANKYTKRNKQFLTRTLFFAEGVLKAHEVCSSRFSFFVFHF